MRLARGEGTTGRTVSPQHVSSHGLTELFPLLPSKDSLGEKKAAHLGPLSCFHAEDRAGVLAFAVSSISLRPALWLPLEILETRADEEHNNFYAWRDRGFMSPVLLYLCLIKPHHNWGEGRDYYLTISLLFSPEYSLKGLMLKLKLQYFDHLRRRTDSFQKTLMLGKIEGGRRKG